MRPDGRDVAINEMGQFTDYGYVRDTQEYFTEYTMETVRDPRMNTGLWILWLLVRKRGKL